MNQARIEKTHSEENFVQNVPRSPSPMRKSDVSADRRSNHFRTCEQVSANDAVQQPAHSPIIDKLTKPQSPMLS